MSGNREILALAIPSIVSNITVPLLGLVDVAIVGHIGNASYIGAIAVGSMIFNIIYWVFGFLRMGTSGMTAQAYGRSDGKEAKLLLIRALSVGMAVACCFVVLQVPLRLLALWLMNTPAETVPLVSTYFNIVIWGAPAMLGLYGLAGWFVGMQDTRVPMLVAILQNIVNILMSLLFVFGLRMQIEGVALGTLTAQWVGFLVALFFARRKWRGCQGDFALSDILSMGELLRFFAVNRDIFLRTLFLVAVNLFFTSAGARQGTMILAVNTLLMTLFSLFSYVLDGFAYAGEALAGKYYGARDVEAFKDTVYRLFGWGILVVVLFTVAYVVGGSDFLTLLTSDVSVIQAASGYLPWTYAIPVTGMAAFVFDGVFIGVTETRGMLVASFLAAVVFFLLHFLLYPYLHNHALWLSFIAHLLVRGLIQMVIYRRMPAKI